MTQTLGANGSFDAMTMSFFGEQQDKLVALLREERTVAKAEVAEVRRELETHRQEAGAPCRVHEPLANIV